MSNYCRCSYSLRTCTVMLLMHIMSTTIATTSATTQAYCPHLCVPWHCHDDALFMHQSMLAVFIIIIIDTVLLLEWLCIVFCFVTSSIRHKHKRTHSFVCHYSTSLSTHFLSSICCCYLIIANCPKNRDKMVLLLINSWLSKFIF